MKTFLLCYIVVILQTAFLSAALTGNEEDGDEWFPERVALFNSDEAKEPCNNYPALCDFKYSNITQVCTHNSYAVGTGLAANQRKTIEQQLEDGVRAFMLDLQPRLNDSTVIELCHTYCDLLDGGTFLDTLTSLRQWLDVNPREVITLFLENSGKFDTTAIAEQFNKADLQKFCYAPRERKDWPSIREMITYNQRVVVFVDNLYGNAVYSYILPQYQYVWETPFQAYLPKPDWSCAKDRPTNGLPSTATEPMYILNHFVMANATVHNSVAFSFPSFANASKVNNDMLRMHAENCTKLLSKPNFIAVDFYDVGIALDLAAGLNGLAPISSRSKHTSSTLPATKSSHSLLITSTLTIFGYFCL